MSDGFHLADGIRPESGIGYYLSKARNVLIDRTDRAVKPLGLSAQQIGVILLLSSGRADTPLELSRALSYDSGSMTRMLDRLEKKGFVVRSRSDADRRMVKLELTPQGRDAAARLPAERFRAERAVARLLGRRRRRPRRAAGAIYREWGG